MKIMVMGFWKELKRSGLGGGGSGGGGGGELIITGKKKKVIWDQLLATKAEIDHFTIVCLVTWPLLLGDARESCS